MLFEIPGSSPSYLPTADELRQGMTVEIVQEDADSQSEETELIIGEVGTGYGDEPEGSHVKLKSGAIGHVQSVVSDD